jgi:hypothetical protein
VNRPGFLVVLVRSEPFRVFQITLGVLLLPVAGIIGLISPAPIGIVVAGAGAALIFRNSRWARRRYILYSRRHPRVAKAMDIGMMRRRRQRKRTPVVGSSLTNRATDPTSPPMSQA